MQIIKRTAGVLVLCAFGEFAAKASLITDTSATAYGLNSVQSCVNGLVSMGLSQCGAASAGLRSWSAAQASASSTLVSASIQGGASGFGFQAVASASALFTDSLTLYGGAGSGVLLLQESQLTYGTGSLAGLGDGRSRLITQRLNFTFGVATEISFAAEAASAFSGSYGDAGTLLVTNRLLSIVILDSMGNSLSGLIYSDTSGSAPMLTGATQVLSGLTTPLSTPEPAAWMLGVIGIGLILAGKRQQRPLEPPVSRHAN